ncbi:hypothetical protein DFH06DRAFT_1198696 [Mycena polygramma]|nr:hypothetical protein DFH06DRAFT_1198696 [Mycena polygramma]
MCVCGTMSPPKAIQIQAASSESSKAPFVCQEMQRHRHVVLPWVSHPSLAISASSPYPSPRLSNQYSCACRFPAGSTMPRSTRVSGQQHGHNVTRVHGELEPERPPAARRPPPPQILVRHTSPTQLVTTPSAPVARWVPPLRTPPAAPGRSSRIRTASLPSPWPTPPDEHRAGRVRLAHRSPASAAPRPSPRSARPTLRRFPAMPLSTTSTSRLPGYRLPCCAASCARPRRLAPHQLLRDPPRTHDTRAARPRRRAHPALLAVRRLASPVHDLQIQILHAPTATPSRARPGRSPPRDLQ